MRTQVLFRYLIILLFLTIINYTLKAEVNIKSSKDPYALHTYYKRTYHTTQGTWISNARKTMMAKSFWKDDDQTDGPSRIEVDLGNQVARFFKGDEQIGQAPISSGMEGYKTPTGSYKVQEKEIEHYSSLYGSFIDRNGRTIGYGKVDDTPPRGSRYDPSPMPYFLRLADDGLGLHSGFLPGYPASHGCIRLPSDMAKKFFRAAKVGTPVEIID